jgi:hypothetical protein
VEVLARKTLAFRMLKEFITQQEIHSHMLGGTAGKMRLSFLSEEQMA